MNIEQLIQERCPNGVEWKTLGECTIMQRGTSITQKTATNGVYPVIAGGKKPAYYCDSFNREGETITVAGSGAYAGFVAYWDEPIFVSDAFSIKGQEGVSIRYLYHILLNMQNKIYATQKGSGVPHVHISSIEKFSIPLPPLEIQSAIADILDKFTALTAELEAELEGRKKQYDFYRNRLLSFDYRSDSNLPDEEREAPHGGGQSNVRWVRLEDAFELRNGYTPSKSIKAYWENGTIPWFRMEDIRQNGRILKDSIQHITPEAVKGAGLFAANSFILATTATIGEHALLIADSLANQRFTNLKIRKSLEKELNTKFFFYYMFIIDEWCKNNTNVSGFASVDMGKLKKLMIPIPPLAEQERIVKILDKFDALTSDLTQGLPAEIEARRQQYEYYREKLLSF